MIVIKIDIFGGWTGPDWEETNWFS